MLEFNVYEVEYFDREGFFVKPCVKQVCADSIEEAIQKIRTYVVGYPAVVHQVKFLGMGIF